MATVSKQDLDDFTNKFFGTDDELKEGIAQETAKDNIKGKITESVMIQGVLHSKNRWSVAKLK
jgi:hypothetical protein